MVFEALTNVQLMALCLYGEARGESLDGKLAVASVVINRVKKGGWYGKGINEVILKKHQFSCFLQSDPNFQRLSDIAKGFDSELQKNNKLKECYWIAKGALEGWLKSNVNDATHYHADYVIPDWSHKMVRIKVIGRHIFYKEV